MLIFTPLNMFLLAIIVLLLIMFLSLLYKKRNVGVLEGIGLKVNPSNPIFGNALDLLKYSVPFWDIQNFQKFGPIYGVSLLLENRMIQFNNNLFVGRCTKAGNHRFISVTQK